MHGLKKAEKFIRFCDAFSLPVLTVTDVRGMKAEEAEEREMAAALAGFVSALSESTVPKVNLITGEAFGTAGIVMNSRAVGADYVLAWPEASVGMMDAEQAVRIMYAGEIGGSADHGEDKGVPGDAEQRSGSGKAGLCGRYHRAGRDEEASDHGF